jgi:hypothetical protein
MGFRYPRTSWNVHERVRVADVSRLSIDPVSAAGIASRAAAAHVQSARESAVRGENAFDGAVSALLAWAGSTDATVVSAVHTRAQTVACRAVAGLGELAAMNTENARQLGAL